MRGITPDNYAEVEKVGRLTFKPLGGKRFHCNQLPDLGRLSAREVKSVRNAIAAFGRPEGRRKEPVKSAPPPPPLLQAEIDRDGYVFCPRCLAGWKRCEYRQYVGRTGEHRCLYCQGRFLAVGRSLWTA